MDVDGQRALISCWASDFCGWLYRRPLPFRILFRIAVGRKAYFDFIGLIRGLEFPVEYWEGPEGEYYKEPMPLDFKKVIE